MDRLPLLAFLGGLLLAALPRAVPDDDQPKPDHGWIGGRDAARPPPAQPGSPFHGADAMTAKPNPGGDAPGVAAGKPPIQVTTWDYGRLSAVVDAFRLRGREPLVDLLVEELDRAELVEPAAVPRDVVTMHSCVRFVDDTGEVRTVTLVYPGEEDSRQGKVTVVTPVGSALLGLRAGATMAWRTLDGRTKRLSVLEVGHQPEAHGLDGASGGSGRESVLSGSLAAAAAG